MKEILTVFSFTAVLSLPAKAQSVNREVLQKAIVDLAERELKNAQLPSLQIAVGLGDTLWFEYACGFADLEHNVAATIDTKYRTASVSKLWTASIAMMLENKGVLDLDAPIQNYCPEFPIKEHTITSRQLLTHTAGIRSYIELEEELSNATNKSDSVKVIEKYNKELLGLYTRYTKVEEALDNFKDDPLIFKPGTDWSYSSQGYRVLGCALEGASGLSYQELTKQMIFEPTGMKNTVEDDAWFIIPNRASGYRLQSGEPLRRADMRDVSENLPAGGHLTTASDLIRFANAYLHYQYFSENTIQTMSTTYMMSDEASEDMPLWRYAIPSGDHYGYGVMLFPSEDTKRFGHTGRQAGSSAILVMIPEKQLSVAVLSNVKGWNGYLNFTNKIEEAMTEFIQEANK